MTNKKPTDNEIVKALECCANCESCDYETTDCPLGKEMECRSILAEYALDLINRQKAEIEAWKHYYNECLTDLKNAHAETEKLKKEIDSYDVFYFCSYSGCEAASMDCWKTCPNSVYNKTRTEAYKEFAYDLKQIPSSVIHKHEIDIVLKEKLGVI